MKDLQDHLHESLHESLRESLLDITAEEHNIFSDVFTNDTITRDQVRLVEEAEHIIIPENVRYIRDNAMGGLPMLKTLEIRSRDIKLGRSCLCGCNRLEKVIFTSDNIKSIVLDKEVFQDCISLTDINLPPDKYTILDGAWSVFKNCTSLEEVALPNRLQTVPDSCFCGCTSLRKLVLPRTCTVLSRQSLSGCTDLTEIDVSHVSQFMRLCFEDCPNLRSLSLDLRRDGLLGEAALIGCTGLEKLELAVNSSSDIAIDTNFRDLDLQELSIRYPSYDSWYPIDDIRKMYRMGKIKTRVLRINGKKV